MNLGHPIFAVCAMVATIVLAGRFCEGQDQSTATAFTNAAADQVVVGITGHYRLGCWTAVSVVSPSTVEGLRNDDSSHWMIETVDGDGVRVQYTQPRLTSVQPTASNELFGYAIPGTEAAPLEVGVKNRSADPDRKVTTRFPPRASSSRGPSLVPSSMPWIIAIGDPLGVDRLGANEILGRDASVAVSKPVKARDLPDSSLGYSGVDLIMINGSGIDLLGSLDGQRQAALTDWLREGGHILWTVGGSLASIKQHAGWLLDLLPYDPNELTTATIDPAALESFTSTQVPLASFDGTRLPKGVGRILLGGRTSQRVSTPLAVDYHVGFGRLTVIAADLDSSMFANWPERLDLITRLTGSVLGTKEANVPVRSRATAFDDLAGQMRSTLDQFSIKRTVGFSAVSLVLLALIAVIGPLDYIFLNRVLGKPLLGWLTFPLVVIGLSALLIQQSAIRSTANDSSSSDATDPFVCSGVSRASNQVEIIDIDASTRTGRAFAWSIVYSQHADRFDLTLRPRNSSRVWMGSVESVMTAPFGYPGEAFGGIQIAGEDGRMPVFSVSIQAASESHDRWRLDSHVEGLPLAPRSSKSLATRIRFQPEVMNVPKLRRRSGGELIEGKLVNPLPVDLIEGMLVYRNWVYVLPTRFPGGGTIASVDSLRQKNFRWLLTRKKALESSSESEAWDPTDFDSPSRVAEMLMFHQSAGGRRYTELKNGPLSSLDLTDCLTDDRCVLVGRLRNSVTELKTGPDKNENFVAPGDRLTMVRVILPVEIDKPY